MHQIYLDNGATSLPKAPGVAEAMAHYILDVGANIGRASYPAASEAALTALGAREKLLKLFHFSDPSHVVFTSGATAALNQAIKGFLHEGDHVIAGALEHNAVMRPLAQLMKHGVAISRMEADEQGFIDPDSLKKLIRPNTKLVVVSHASNVCGTLAPIEEIAAVCKEHGIPLVLDAAQTAGHYPVDFEALSLSALCVPAHKGLLGPQGVGALLLSPAFAKSLEPLISGGTGSMSDSEEIPSYMPDKFEAGTLNLPGIYGFDAALSFVLETGVEALRERETALTARFLTGVEGVRSARLVGTAELARRVGVISLDFLEKDNAAVAFALERDCGILTRCGLHCAPNAHKTLRTFPHGTVRFSVGYYTTEVEIDAAVAAIEKICEFC
ncbi:MAG TPA: aminotransferase class V-fold PLP-dependent enzyme [Clostridia bacterium]|nr:aminotransferase class V-fold PLP-dependent enzyme [Clostridia bacterium]